MLFFHGSIGSSYEKVFWHRKKFLLKTLTGIFKCFLENLIKWMEVIRLNYLQIFKSLIPASSCAKICKLWSCPGAIRSINTLVGRWLTHNSHLCGRGKPFAQCIAFQYQRRLGRRGLGLKTAFSFSQKNLPKSQFQRTFWSQISE